MSFQQSARCGFSILTLVFVQRFQALWELNRIHEKVTQHTFFGSWENMAYYHLFPTAANRALAEYEHKWKDFNMDVIDSARKVGSLSPSFQTRCISQISDSHALPRRAHVPHRRRGRPDNGNGK